MITERSERKGWTCGVSKNVLYFIFNEGRADQTNALLRSFSFPRTILRESAKFSTRSENDTATISASLRVPHVYTLKRSGECLFGFGLFLYEFVDHFTCLALAFGLLGKLSL